MVLTIKLIVVKITEPGVQSKWTEEDKIPSQPKSKAVLGHVPCLLTPGEWNV